MASVGQAALPAAPSDAEPSPYMWLVQEEVGGSSGSRWSPLSSRDSQRLERAVTGREPVGKSGAVPVECGRYDVDLRERKLRAVYWDEPARPVLRSLWFHGRGGDAIPYQEQDAEEIEAAFQRLRASQERKPLLVPVNKGLHDVRFEVVAPVRKEEEEEEQGFAPLAAAAALFGANEREKRSATSAGSGAIKVGPSAIAGELQYTASQELTERKAGEAQEREPVWRGWACSPGAADASKDDPESELPAHVGCLIFVVHGIGQYHRSEKSGSGSSKFHEDVAKVRRIAVRHLRQRMQEADLPGRFEFLPLEWFEPIHVDVGIGRALNNVTLPSVPALRDFANFAIADMMVYQDDTWRERIHRELQKKMDRLYALFCARTPSFSGEVAVIGHSLGSVVMFDLIQRALPGLGQGLLLDVRAASSKVASEPRAAAAARSATPPQDESEPAAEPASSHAAGSAPSADLTVAAAAAATSPPPADSGVPKASGSLEVQEAAGGSPADSSAVASATPDSSSSTSASRIPAAPADADGMDRGRRGGDSAGEAGSPCPAPRCFFSVGSPLGMFLSIRLSHKSRTSAQFFQGLDVRWPAGCVGRGWRFFNVFHPGDPIAYRIEPLLNSDYVATQPRVVPHQGGLRFHHQIREWWRAGTKTWSDEASRDDASPPADVLLVHTAEEGGAPPSAMSFLDSEGERGKGNPRPSVAVDRLDYALQESAFESMNELLSAINSHFQYWESEDLHQFVVDQLLECLESKSGREGAPSLQAH